MAGSQPSASGSTSYGSQVSGGFASPADDHVDAKLSLDAYCIKNPAAPHLARFEGDSMVEFGIHHGDMVVVDRSMEATYGKIGSKRMWLMAGNPDFPPTELPEGHELAIQGVVTLLIHKRG